MRPHSVTYNSENALDHSVTYNSENALEIIFPILIVTLVLATCKWIAVDIQDKVSKKEHHSNIEYNSSIILNILSHKYENIPDSELNKNHETIYKYIEWDKGENALILYDNETIIH